MRKRMILISLSILLLLCLLPVTALAANYTDSFSRVFDENEYEQLKTFLNLDSASEFGYSNGSSMSYMYNENEPYDWYHVTWELKDSVYHVTAINWSTDGSYYSLNFTGGSGKYLRRLFFYQ
jgi:hypothetical protein